MLHKLKNLSGVIARGKFQEEDICRKLMLDTLHELNPLCVYMGQLHSSGYILEQTGFGYDNQKEPPWFPVRITESLPLSDALRENRIVSVNSKEKCNFEYPGISKHPVGQMDWVSLVCVPIVDYGVIHLSLGSNFNASQEVEMLLEIVANMVLISLNSLQFQAKPLDEEIVLPKAEQSALSERQLLIKDLIVKGFTNYEIAKKIGYSHSLVRQESIKIFSKLGIKDRKELMKFFLADE